MSNTPTPPPIVPEFKVVITQNDMVESVLFKQIQPLKEKIEALRLKNSKNYMTVTHNHQTITKMCEHMKAGFIAMMEPALACMERATGLAGMLTTVELQVHYNEAYGRENDLQWALTHRPRRWEPEISSPVIMDVNIRVVRYDLDRNHSRQEEEHFCGTHTVVPPPETKDLMDSSYQANKNSRENDDEIKRLEAEIKRIEGTKSGILADITMRMLKISAQGAEFLALLQNGGELPIPDPKQIEVAAV